MKNYTEMLPYIKGSDYENHFWNALRGKVGHSEHLNNGINSYSGGYTLTHSDQEKYSAALKQESLFRNIATDIRVYDTKSKIRTVNGEDVAVWVPAGGSISVTDGMDDFGTVTLETHKLAAFLKLEENFAHDATFKIEDYLVSRFAKNFARAEDNAFINGTGTDEPTGILDDEGGADIGVTAASITYEDVVELFFSVASEYRKNGVWLMNDETALVLRTLKDDGGNYIWNHTNDTILGKKVYISEFMPYFEPGSKPIAFGDFSYYWITTRTPVSVRTLVEKFAALGYIGYLAYEFLDGHLIRSEAVKVMQIADTAD